MCSGQLLAADGGIRAMGQRAAWTVDSGACWLGHVLRKALSRPFFNNMEQRRRVP